MAETEAFEGFMKAHQNMVYSIAVRLLGNETEAADIAQETFLKAYDRFANLQHNPAAPGWLRTVATNLCLNHLTRYRARWRFFSEYEHEDAGSFLESLLPDPTNRAETDEQEHRRQYLEVALRKLPDNQRVPLILYHFEEMSYEDIARRLGVSLSKVKTDIHRARQSLRRWLRPDMDGWEEQARLKSALPKDKEPDRRHRLPWPPWSAPVSTALSRI
jgi:RNA polymerase sigma-70 factor (ECF subfamily)